MKRLILALVCMVALLASPVWGDGTLSWADPSSNITWVEPRPEDDMVFFWDATLSAFADISLDLDDVLHALKRCREFVDDYEYSSDPSYIGSVTLLYIPPPSMYDYLKDQAENEIENQKAKIEQVEKERQLRKDIETLIKKLEAICENYQ